MLTIFYRIVFNFSLWLGILSGCATVPDSPDPFENVNRAVFGFNEDVDKAILKPIAETYKTIVPEPIDKGVTNFFSNLGEVVVVVNDALQFKVHQAASDTTRFLINSTIGLLGFIDVSTEFGLPKHYEDFGQTLGYWGLNSGPYIVLPFFGPSSLRDAPGKVVDTLVDPRLYLTNNDVRNFFIGTNVLRAVDARADLLGLEKVLNEAALDKYTYVRDAYLKSRENSVYDGNPPQGKKDNYTEEDLFNDLK